MTGAQPRFGTVGSLFGNSNDDLPKVRLAKKPVAASPVDGDDSSSSTATPKARAKRVRQRPVAKFVYAGVTPQVRVDAPRLAAATGQTIADLAVIGASNLTLPPAPVASQANADHLPLSGTRKREVLVDMQIRVTGEQRDWFDKQVATAGGMSLRRYVGLALQAQVHAKRSVLTALDQAGA